VFRGVGVKRLVFLGIYIEKERKDLPADYAPTFKGSNLLNLQTL